MAIKVSPLLLFMDVTGPRVRGVFEEDQLFCYLCFPASPSCSPSLAAWIPCFLARFVLLHTCQHCLPQFPAPVLALLLILWYSYFLVSMCPASSPPLLTHYTGV